MTHSRPRNHKPRDLYACVERLHQDGTWRLVYTNTLYSDPLYNNKLKSVPDFDARSDQITRRDHHLMWLLTHIETEQNQEFIRTAGLRPRKQPFQTLPVRRRGREHPQPQSLLENWPAQKHRRLAPRIQNTSMGHSGLVPHHLDSAP